MDKNFDFEELRALSEAATPGTLYTVDQPWGDGTWIVAGSPDPHAGYGVADCAGAFDRESEREAAPEAIRDVSAADDAAFLAAAANHVRTLLAATPSKPVGDGGEASAPPAGGGVVDAAYRERLAQAFYEADPHYVPGEYVEHHAVSPGGYLSWQEALSQDAEFAGDRMFGPVTAKAYERADAFLAAAPAAPESASASAPPGGGGADLSLLRQAAKAGRLRIECRERLPGADPDAGMTWPIEVELPCINGLSAWFTLGTLYSPDRAAQGYTDGALNDDLARSFAAHVLKSLAAPEPAGGDGWRFDMEAAPRDGTPILCVEYDDPTTVVDAHWFGDGRYSSWRGGFGQMRRPVAWRRFPAPPTPANAGAEGGQA